MALHFTRNTKVFLQQGSSGTVWQIPVLDGFSFSQATNASSISLNESLKEKNGKSRRSRRTFNDSYAPAEWSFSTYMRPFIAKNADTGNVWEASGSDNNHHAVEEALWANFVANNSHTESSGSAESVWTDGITNATTKMTIDFTGSDVGKLGEFTLFFVFDESTDKVYKISKCVVNEATIDFDIDGIATIQWSGFGRDISDEEATNPTVDIDEAIDSTNNFIRNRLTTLTVQSNDATTYSGSGTDEEFNVTLTGGSLSFNNNITFLTPETLGRVDKPFAHVPGTREIGGSFTAYLDNSANSTESLVQHLVDQDQVITNSFNLEFSIGGASAPKVVVKLPRCHLEIPVHQIEDVVSAEFNFHALSADLAPSAASGFESELEYYGVTY